MAHHKSAIKRLKQSKKREQRNRHYKTWMKNRIRKALQMAQEGKRNEAYDLVQSTVYRVAQKGVIPWKRASRKVSRLSRKVLYVVSTQ